MELPVGITLQVMFMAGPLAVLQKKKRRKNWFGLRGLAKFAKIFTYG